MIEACTVDGKKAPIFGGPKQIGCGNSGQLQMGRHTLFVQLQGRLNNQALFDAIQYSPFEVTSQLGDVLYTRDNAAIEISPSTDSEEPLPPGGTLKFDFFGKCYTKFGAEH